jgi:HAD superfamily hydrolase (TIGR01458 family)
MGDVSEVLPPAIRGVLVDLAGVLYDGDAALPGAIDAVHRLHAAGVPVRYVTNTTRSTRADIVVKLHRMGLPIEEREVFTAPLAAKRVLRDRGLRPLLLVHPGLRPEFADVDAADPNAVVVADVGDALTYADLNGAFRLLMTGAPLIAMARNRYFKDADGGLSLDAGPFVAALESASGATAEVVGKPAAPFFQLALSDLGCDPAEAVMVGDDVRDDVLGAAAAGLRGLLVRTGKFRPDDEAQLDHPHVAAVADFAAAVDAILAV